MERNYRDQPTHRVVEHRSPFVERLTHDSHIIQVDRISNHYQTKLDKLHSVFEQNNFVDDKGMAKYFMHSPDNEDVKILTDILHHCGTNPEERKQIETEQEVWRSVSAIYEEREKEVLGIIREKEKKIDEREEKDKALDERVKLINEKDRLINEKDRLINEKDRLIEEKDRLIEELKRKLILEN